MDMFNDFIKFIVTNKGQIKVYDLRNFNNTVKHFRLKQGTFTEVMWRTNSPESLTMRPAHMINDSEFKKIKELIISKFSTRQDFLNKYATKQVALYNEMRYNFKFIKSIKNPTEEMKLKIVKLNYEALQFIKNPSEKIQLAAVKCHGCSALFYIKNPSKKVQLEAIKQDGTAIRFMNNPSEEMQLSAIKSHGLAIVYIKNPSEEMQLEAVKQDGAIIRYIINPSEEVQLAAVREDCNAIKYIKNPTESVKSIVLKKQEEMNDVQKLINERANFAGFEIK